jgi:HK97 family phage prohead protease
MKKYISKFENTNDDNPEWAAVFTGYFTTIDRDRGNDIVLPTAFIDTMPRYMENPVLLFNHNPDNIIGQVLDYKIEDKGVWIKAGIQGFTTLGRDIAALVKSGILKTMSFAYDVLEADWGRDGTPNILKKLEIYEVSVATIPMNVEAVVIEAKQKGIDFTQVKTMDMKTYKNQQYDYEILNKYYLYLKNQAYFLIK